MFYSIASCLDVDQLKDLHLCDLILFVSVYLGTIIFFYIGLGPNVIKHFTDVIYECS
jgi:hypothetical protein